MTGSSTMPRWDGNDVWNIDRTLVVSGEFGEPEEGEDMEESEDMEENGPKEARY